MLFFFSFFGCKTNLKEKRTTLKIESFLSEKQVQILNNCTSIELYSIRKKLIEGTKNEYANKTEFVKNLTKKQENKFLYHFFNDNSYWWNKTPTGSFEPIQQFIVKSNDSQFLVLFSQKNKELAIIDLEGQKSLVTKFTKIKI